MLQRRYNPAEWWHLLSLDAPTVAVLWSWSFARAMHLRISLLAPLILGLVSWLLYVADRILDGLRSSGSEQLRERHVFHARHRGCFLVAGSILVAFSIWIILHRMYARTLKDDLFLSVFAFLYLCLVHLPNRKARPRARRWLPKELAVGVIFAAATAVPAWSRLGTFSDLARVWLGEAVLLFAVLCWINCVAIEKWEAVEWKVDGVHATTCWAAHRLREISAGLAVLSVAGAWLAPTRGLMALYLASLLSCGFLAALDTRRARLSPLTLRIAADAALLTPLAFLPILR